MKLGNLEARSRFATVIAALALAFLFFATPSFAAIGDDSDPITTLSSCGVHNTATVNRPNIDAFSTRVTARLDGGPLIYDQTFALPPNDPAVQAAFNTARAKLKAARAASIQGPTVLSSSSQTTSSLVSSTTTSTLTTNETIGGFSGATILIGSGDNSVDPLLQGTASPCTRPFFVEPGTVNFNLVDDFETTNTYQPTVTHQAVYGLTGSLAGSSGRKKCASHAGRPGRRAHRRGGRGGRGGCARRGGP